LESNGTIHYVALYDVFPNKDGSRRQVLLAMQPFVDETNQTATNHIEYITVILNDDYNRNSESAFSLFGCQ